MCYPIKFVNSDSASTDACLTFSCLVLKKWPSILQKSYGVNTARFLKQVWPFFKLLHERVRLIKIKSIIKRSQETNTCSNSTIETLKKGVKYVQSL